MVVWSAVFGLTLQGVSGTLNGVGIESYCTDLTQELDGGPPITFTVQASFTPKSTTNPSLATNDGEIGYLYNTYGRFINKLPTPNNNTFGDATNAAAFQLAIWALEYNVNPVTSLSSPGTPFEVNQAAGTTAANIISSANAYLADAAGKSGDFIYLNATAANGRGLQGMMSTDLLNFTNTGTNVSSVSTSIKDSSGSTVTGALGEKVYDTATVTGTAGPATGTVTYNFYNTSTPIYGVTIPTTTQTVTLSGGTVAHTSATAALGAGTYSYIATYSGDSNYASAIGTVEPLTINKGTITLNTTIYNAANNSVVTGALPLGSSVYDTVSFTGAVAGFTPNLSRGELHIHEPERDRRCG